MSNYCRSFSLLNTSTTTTNDSTSSTTTTAKPKRSMRLSIAPDEEELDSMQVIMHPSPIETVKSNNTNIKTTRDAANSSCGNGAADRGERGWHGEEEEEEEVDEDNCIYTVGSVEYSVHHTVSTCSSSSSSSTSTSNSSSSIANTTTAVISDSEPTSATTELQLLQKFDTEACTNSADVAREVLEASSSGEGENKKSVSRMGSFFKKSSTAAAAGGGEKATEGNGDSYDGGSNDMNNHSGDGSNNNNNNDRNNGHRPNKSNTSSTSPRDATFGPERIQFAHESTLPLHSGSECAAPSNRPSWTPVPGTEFKVRVGPNYPKNGKKENSHDSLYEVYCVRYFRSAKGTVGGASRIMPLPELTSGDNNIMAEENIVDIGAKAKAGEGGNSTTSDPHHPELFGTKVPDVLVVHFMLPYETPNMFKTKEDGAGGECVYYLKPSKRFLDEISGRLPPTPATKLFVRWCNECEFNAKMRGRFKCMALVRDIERHNLSLLKSYNGKPVLITESGRVCSGVQGGVRYLEMIANGEFNSMIADAVVL
jgi:hypothetical protein